MERILREYKNSLFIHINHKFMLSLIYTKHFFPKMSKIKNFALDLSTVTTEDLVKTLDKKFNYTMGWKSTVFSQKNLEDIAHNVLEVLYKRDSWVFDAEIYVSTEVFEIVLESVINIYEGYVNLKRM